MEIILLQKVSRLGNMGDVATVKDGFARNYLIPQGMALRATKAIKAEFDARKDEIAKQNDARKAEAQKLADKLEGTIIELVRAAADDGKLYGSVTVRDIGTALEEKGFEIPRQNLLLEAALKTTGSFTVTVMPHPEIELELPVRIARNESEFLAWDDEEEAEEETPVADATTEEVAETSEEEAA